MFARSATLLLLGTLAACSLDDGPDRAVRTMAAFQDALQQRDEDACRQLLTLESQPVLSEMAWEAVAAQKPLRIMGARREHQDSHAFRVDVQDPNANFAGSQFVVVREYGRLVIDLIASAALSAKIVSTTEASMQLEPRKLTPADHQRIREYELSQPGR